MWILQNPQITSGFLKNLYCMYILFRLIRHEKDWIHAFPYEHGTKMRTKAYTWKSYDLLSQILSPGWPIQKNKTKQTWISLSLYLLTNVLYRQYFGNLAPPWTKDEYPCTQKRSFVPIALFHLFIASWIWTLSWIILMSVLISNQQLADLQRCGMFIIKVHLLRCLTAHEYLWLSIYGFLVAAVCVQCSATF